MIDVIDMERFAPVLHPVIRRLVHRLKTGDELHRHLRESEPRQFVGDDLFEGLRRRENFRPEVWPERQPIIDALESIVARCEGRPFAVRVDGMSLSEVNAARRWCKRRWEGQPGKRWGNYTHRTGHEKEHFKVFVFETADQRDIFGRVFAS